jgi:hypothetical protein
MKVTSKKDWAEPLVSFHGKVMLLRQALRKACIYPRGMYSNCDWENVAPRTRRKFRADYAKFLQKTGNVVDEPSNTAHDGIEINASTSIQGAARLTDFHADDDEMTEMSESTAVEEVEEPQLLLVAENGQFDDDETDQPICDEPTQQSGSTNLINLPSLERQRARLTEHDESKQAQRPVSAFNSAAPVPVANIFRVWKIKNRVAGKQLEELMTLLRNNNDYHEFAALPKTWRTMFKVDNESDMKTDYVVQEWGTAEEKQRYVYVGIETRLEQHRQKYIPLGSRGPDDEPPHYEIVMNVDGAKFADKAVMKSLWPMQILVWAVSPAGVGTERHVLETKDCQPHIVGLHHANTQPEDFNRYLYDFCAEVVRLDPNNIAESTNRNITVTLMACICDGPAREKCKCIHGMLSVFPCEKCFSVGIKMGKNCTSCWSTLGHVLRSDRSFLKSIRHVRSEFNEETGKEEPIKSPLRLIKYFGMVTGFPLEPMHSVYHGAIRNWLKVLFMGSRVLEKALSMPQRILVERRLDFVKNFTPSEFKSSALKSMKHLKNWKAAETRHFIYYAAVIVFNGIVPEEVFQQLCNLLVALCFIGGESAKPVPEQHLEHAQKLIEKFFHEVSRNNFRLGLPPSLHWLLHIVNDLRFFKCHLERLGVWPFENAMRFMLNSVHGGNRVVEQILNREDEKMEHNLQIGEDGTILTDNASCFVAEDAAKTKPYVKTNQRGKKTLIFPKACGDFVLTTSENNRDCHFVYQDGPDPRRDVVIGKFMDVIEKDDGRLVVVGQQYKEKDYLFKVPCGSDRFYGFKFWDLCATKEDFELADIVAKMYAIPDMAKIKTEDKDTESEVTEKAKLAKYLCAALPRNAPKAPPAPNFRIVCGAHFDCWEGMAVQHTFENFP